MWIYAYRHTICECETKALRVSSSVLRYQRSGKTITTCSCHKNIQDLDFFAIMPGVDGTPEETFDAVEDVEDYEDILAHIVDLSKKTSTTQDPDTLPPTPAKITLTGAACQCDLCWHW